MAAEIPEGDEEFCQHIRRFISDTIPAEMAERNKRGYHATKEDVVFWTQALNARGWSVPNWPREHGGPGWTTRQLHFFEYECFMGGAPPLSPQGLHLVGPVIYTFGSSAQKAYFLPPIRSAQHMWAQGFSEPNAGSDLVALKTRALKCGDEYIVNGQKTWTSDAHKSEWLFLLVRTDTSAKRQRGISFLLVDSKTPGITVKPIYSIDNAHILNEVFFEDVRVPVGNLVGEEGKGWTYAKHLLTLERSFSADISRCRMAMTRLKTIRRHILEQGPVMPHDILFDNKLAQLEVELLAQEASVFRVIAEEESGESNTAVPTSSILKVCGTELTQKFGKLMVEALGTYGIPLYAESDCLGPWPEDASGPEFAAGVVSDFLYRRSASIYGGTNEVQRNIIANMLFG
ncbi:MAG: acyl-CoA dehydrogenase [Halieaceae bacterium]|jgi:alkylation response protein AidB-like acyl-CoA dehydrogenase|nr:acyl-CoA dehydrogenase [Halieaceae bacterium]